ncbi:MAG TPA: hypothetical protein VI837_08350 [Blastocatellia bacterium]|nr:hypothetical protein [Blastocatellia bacterium]
MDLSDPNTHSFIVKIWIERAPEGRRSADWRGHITHVPSGQRQYLKDLREIRQFMLPYLKVMGADVGRLGRAKRWLKRLVQTG